MQFEVNDWVATGLGSAIVALVGAWMASIHKQGDRAAAAAERAAAALAQVSKDVGALVERTKVHSELLDGLGRDVRVIRESTAETAREGQAVAQLVARHAEVLEGLRCQGQQEAGHG